MFRQIEVAPEDRKFHRIVWFDQSNKLADFELTTVTYGTKFALFLEMRALRQMVEDDASGNGELRFLYERFNFWSQ